VLILAIIVSVLIFAGSITSVSAATVNTSQINQGEHKNVGLQDNIQEDPDISGNIVVYRKTKYIGTPHWSMDEVVSSVVYWKNIATGSSGRVTSSNAKQWHPKISGTRVMWLEGGNYGPYTLYVKNLATGAMGKITSLKYRSSYDISGTRVMWEFNNHLYVKNLATGSGGIVTSGSIYNPAISGVRVVWTDLSLDRVYVKNIQTGATGSIYSYGASNADISGTRVVWHDGTHVYWKDIATGSGGLLGSGSGIGFHINNAKISGNWVIWEAYVSPYVLIYAKNVVSKTLVKINQQKGGQFGFSAVISGNIVVWEDWKPYLFVDYWKNVVTKAGGRVQV
jgi:hypothetical protein